jgi:PHS family inorganic phosphate transporter-like MFS transporter
VYELIDAAGFGTWIVFVAGVGFLTDAYDVSPSHANCFQLSGETPMVDLCQIFAVNMVLPMLAIVFWNGEMPLSVTTAINSATLFGTFVGQLTFGVLADRYGRKKMYGLELLIVIFGTLGLALSSKGAAGSIHILGWLIFWRLLMGFGIGGDYPLSAVITAEYVPNPRASVVAPEIVSLTHSRPARFAPRRRRARMLAAVFFMQPLGQLIANVVAVIATAAYHRHISHNTDPLKCVGECMQTTDKIWRWVVGIGAVPPTIAVVFRLFIPESPRYTLEVEMDSETAVHDSEWYFQVRSSVAIERDVEEPAEESTEEPVVETVQSIEMRPTGGSLRRSTSQQDDDITEHPANLTVPPAPPGYTSSSTQGSSVGVKDETTMIPPSPSLNRPASIYSSHSVLSAVSSIGPDPVVESNDNQPDERPRARKPTWKEYRTGFYRYFFTEGNWTDLAGTASAWMLLDFSFYFLGVNSSKIIANIWGTSDTASVYETLMQNGWRALITNSIGAIAGGAVVIAMVRWRKNVQMYGFLVLASLFFAVGWTYVYLLHTRFLGAIIVLYVLCQLFFNLGM